MPGSIESPYSADELETLPDGTNVYDYEYSELVREVESNDNRNRINHAIQNNITIQTQLASPRDPPRTDESLTMMTARQSFSPTIAEIPTNISIPSSQHPSFQTVASAPTRTPSENPSRTPKTNNTSPSTHQQTIPSQVSVRSVDPPEDIPHSNNNYASQTQATASLTFQPSIDQRGATAISVASHSTISSPRPHPSAPPTGEIPHPYATLSEVDDL